MTGRNDEQMARAFFAEHGRAMIWEVDAKAASRLNDSYVRIKRLV